MVYEPPASCTRVNSTIPPTGPILAVLPTAVPTPAQPVPAAMRAPSNMQGTKAKGKEAEEDLWGAALGYLMKALGLSMHQETTNGSHAALDVRAGRSGALIGRSQSAPEPGSDDKPQRHAARSAKRPCHHDLILGTPLCARHVARVLTSFRPRPPQHQCKPVEDDEIGHCVARAQVPAQSLILLGLTNLASPGSSSLQG